MDWFYFLHESRGVAETNNYRAKGGVSCTSCLRENNVELAKSAVESKDVYAMR